MDTQSTERDARNTASNRPNIKLLTRDAPQSSMEVKPEPRREDDHPPDEPGYGHGV